MSTHNRPKILLIDEDVQLGTVVKEALELKKYKVTWIDKAKDALKLTQSDHFDICITEANLSEFSGIDFAKEFRKNDIQTPILFMSSKSTEKEMVYAYCAGGDDFIAKPFSTTELSLRIYALLKRSKPNRQTETHPALIQFGSYTFDYKNRLLCHKGEDMSLTKKESEVLRMLAQNVNNIVKRESVLIDVWGENDYFMGRSMDVYIARLRKKLALDESVSIINVHRMGFKLEVKSAQA